MSAKVAGTIMYKTEAGKYVFLVKPQANGGFQMLSTEKDDQQTPLAAVLIALQKTLAIDVNQLRLINLANIKLESENVSFFVFQWQAHQPDFYTEQLALISKSGFQFEAPSQFAELLDKLQVTSVPHLN